MKSYVPGIRTMVFIKGCPLGNRVVLTGDGLLTTDREFCGACVKACPTGSRALAGRAMSAMEALNVEHMDSEAHRRFTGVGNDLKQRHIEQG